MGGSISVVGQLHSSYESHCVPFHHSVDVDSIVCSILLKMISARLDCEGTFFHEADVVSS